MKISATLGALLLLTVLGIYFKPIFDGGIPVDPWCTTEAADEMLARNQRQTIKIQDLTTRAAGDQIVLFGHRGGYTCEEKFSALEDAVSNVHKAVRMGIDGYETDIWPTKDGKWVSHHDSKLKRTTTGTGNVMEHTLAELREFNLHYVQSGAISSEKIPSLEELLLAGDGRIIFLLQVKAQINERFPELQKLVKEVRAQDNVLYWVKARKDNVDAFEKLINSGIEDIPETVVWRIANIDQLQDVAARIRPRMVDITLDIPPPGRTEWSDETFDKYFPDNHVALVEAALKYPFIIMVSRNRTNKYMDFLYEKGVRVFASKKAEVQLHHAINIKTHF